MALKATLQGIFQILSNHASTLLYYHDPISSKGGQTKVKSQNGSKWNTAFLFPLLSVIISILYGTVFMVYSETGGQLDWETLKTCPVMMNHQAFPRVIWAQDDFAWAVAASVATALYAISLRNPYTLDRYQVAVVVYSHSQSGSSSVRLSIHGKSKLFTLKKNA